MDADENREIRARAEQECRSGDAVREVIPRNMAQLQEPGLAMPQVFLLLQSLYPEKIIK